MTVGQAPKDHSAIVQHSSPSDDANAGEKAPAESYIQQVQTAAASAYGATAATVGDAASKVKGALGVQEKGVEGEVEKKEVGDGQQAKQKELVDGLADKHVEGFLRDQYKSAD
jgi:ClpP class serine protease